jgi:FkbM family methyltransferase
MLFKCIKYFKNKIFCNKNNFYVSEIDWVEGHFKNQKCGVMVDVGAHFGESFEPFAIRGWEVLAFEPDTHEGKHAAIHARLNSNSHFFNFALSSVECDKSPFYVSGVSTGISGLIPFHSSHAESSVVVVKTLRGVLEEFGIRKVDFLKIDTEGNDLLVLQGLGWDIKPEVILCEFEDAKTKLAGYTFDELGNYLVKGGYRVFVSEWYPIKQYGVKHAWRRFCSYPCKLKDHRAWGNFLAILPGRVDAFLEVVNGFGIRFER